MPLAPALQEYLAPINAMDAPGIDTLPIETARQLGDAAVDLGAKPAAPVTEVTDRTIPGPAGDIPVRIYVPGGAAPFPVVAYFHGGGFVLGSIETHDRIARRICRASNALVVSVGYRLAPEHRFPAALDDCMAVTHWLADHAADLRGDRSRIAVAGDSAGGNLAAAVTLASRADDGPGIAAQLLVYPVTDAACATPSFVQNAEGYLLSAAAMRWFWAEYLGPDGDPDSGYASVLRAPDLSDLPPTLVITAEFDPLRDEGEAYAEHLREAGNTVTLHRFDGMVHGFVGMDDLVDDAEAAMTEIGEFLRTHFSSEP
jgi:acetyl esterase